MESPSDAVGLLVKAGIDRAHKHIPEKMWKVIEKTLLITILFAIIYILPISDDWSLILRVILMFFGVMLILYFI